MSLRLFRLFILLVALPAVALRAEDPTIRVGIYSNPPKVYVNEAGQAAGFWPDLVRSIATEAGYSVEWVHGTWEETLLRLESGDIDLMVDVAVTPERRSRFEFGEETVHVSWSRIYATPGRKIQSIPDLEGMRIAALAESINLEGPEGLRNLLRKFAVKATIVPMDDYAAVFRSLEQGAVDAAVTNRDFGNRMEARFNIQRTPILFQPADLRFAFSSNSKRMEELKEVFDSSLREQKLDRSSDYYSLQGKWLGQPRESESLLPSWLKWTLAGLLALTILLLGGLMLVEMRVRSRTRQIRAQQEQLRARDENLRLSNDNLTHLLESRRAILNSLPAHIALLDAEGVILEVNEQWKQRTAEGYSGSAFPPGGNYLELCGRLRSESTGESENLVAGIRKVLEQKEAAFSMEYPAHSPDRLQWFKVTAAGLAPGLSPTRGAGAVVMHIDITERKLAELELNRLAFQDPATGLPSRIGFARSMRRRLDRMGWNQEAILIVMDIVAMRDINDVHGYDVGDDFLFSLGHRLREQAGDRGLAGRTGGDEFVLYIVPGPDESPEQSVQDLSRILSAPFELQDVTISVTVRFGYTMLGHRERSVEELIREAELALFRNREEVGQTVKAYTSELSELTRERILLTREMKKALTLDEFEMHFQPKVDLTSGQILGAEALIRWNHPERGMQSPGLFIPVAEKSHLIAELGDWILNDVIQHLADWQRLGLPSAPVAINISIVQFRQEDFAKKLQDLLIHHDVGPDRIVLEITESVFEQESPMLRSQLRELQEMGIRLSLDDFGTGYSSLKYLQDYPFDEIKIDQSFVRNVLQPSSREIVRTVLGLARALHADVVAEGIETPEIRDALIDLGCRLGQGYLYSPPVDAPRFRSLLQSRAPLPES